MIFVFSRKFSVGFAMAYLVLSHLHYGATIYEVLSCHNHALFVRLCSDTLESSSTLFTYFPLHILKLPGVGLVRSDPKLVLDIVWDVVWFECPMHMPVLISLFDSRVLSVLCVFSLSVSLPVWPMARYVIVCGYFCNVCLRARS